MKACEEEKIVAVLKRGRLRTDSAKDQQILDTALRLYRCNQSSKRPLRKQRWVCSRTVKLASVAAMLVFALMVSSWLLTDNSAWAVEQTLAALQQVETLYVQGQTPYGEEDVHFQCWIRFPQEREEGLQLRYESEKKTVVVDGEVAYEYWPEKGRVKVENGPTMRGLKLWYKAAELSPWLSGSIFKTFKLLADDWVEVVDKDPFTGREIVHVTCSYPPTSNSFYLQVDPATQLFVAARMWENLHQDGPVVMDIQTFEYNPTVDADLFTFTVPEGVLVSNRLVEEGSRILFDRAEKRFHQEKQPAEALPLYWQVYYDYQDLDIARTALMMVGICHDRLGQHDRAIEAYEKAIREYPDRPGWSESIYFYLACEYERAGRSKDALAAYRRCIKLGTGIRDEDAFPLKQARERIARMPRGNEQSINEKL